MGWASYDPVAPEDAGVDPARLDVLLRRVRLEVEHGPLPSASVDAVVSAFGIVFARDPAAAAAEAARVLGPAGRAVISAWIPEGPIATVMRLRAEALAAAGAPSGAPPFAWHEAAALARLLDRHGFSIERFEHELTFIARSAAEFLDAELRDHPMWLDARDRAADLRPLRDRALAILEAANEQEHGFRVTSRYAVAVARRG